MSFVKRIPGLCDRCGQRYPLHKLKFEFVLGRSTGLRICPTCIDPSHPQLDTRNIRTNDRQSVKDSRSDSAENIESRKMFSWNPVGVPLTSTAITSLGRVTALSQDNYGNLFLGDNYLALGNNPLIMST